MPSFDANVLPATTGLDLGDATHRWDVYAQNLDLSGGSGITSDITFDNTANRTITMAADPAAARTLTISMPAGNNALATSGSGITLATGNGAAGGGDGGAFALTTGRGFNGHGGDFSVTTGRAQSSVAGDGGDVAFVTGQGSSSSTGRGGNFSVTLGLGGGNNPGGAFTFTAGAGSGGGAGGSFALSAGNAPGAGAGGSITLTPGTSVSGTAGSIVLAGNTQISSTAVFNMPTTNIIASTGILQFGTGAANPAESGTIRFGTADSIKFRDFADGADINGLSKDGSDIVRVGDAAGVRLAASGASPIKNVLSTSTSINFASPGANTIVDSAGITLTGVADDGTWAVFIAPAAGVMATSGSFTGYVSAANEVKVRYHADVGNANPADGVFRIVAVKF